MKIITKLLLITSLFITIEIAIAEKVGSENILNTRMQATINKDRIKYNLPALAVSITLPGEEIIRDYVIGNTTLHGNTPIKESNLFQIGSITKSFTAVIALQLIAEGKLDIDTPLGKWLPQYPHWKLITLKQLLNQTSGIYNYSDITDFKRNLIKNPTQWDLKELADLAYHHKPNFNFLPGHGWGYSNTNYVLIAMIIESVTGHSFSDEMNKRLLKNNLGLLNTYYPPYPNTVFNRIVHGYDEEGKNAPRNTDITNIDTSWGGPAGALISNSHDIALWGKQLFSGKVLKAQELHEMTSLVSMKTGKPIQNNHESRYGFGIGSDLEGAGFNIRYGRVYDHSGGMLGYLSHLIYLPCYDMVIALTTNTNRKNASLEKIADDVVAVVLGSKEWQRYKKTHRVPKYCLHAVG